jgi:hypothetical protein
MAKRGMPTTMGMAQMFSEKDDANPSFPMKEAQRDMLRQVIELSEGENLSFKKGDPVHYLDGVGPLISAAKAGMVFAFWRYLDPANPIDLLRMENAREVELVTLPDVDCLIVSFNGRDVTFEISCSRLLVPGDTAEAA